MLSQTPSNESSAEHPLLTASVVAHEDAHLKLILVRLSAAKVDAESESRPTCASIVIDRSGSMSGSKLNIAKKATARLIRSLRPIDRAAVVAYADNVAVVSGLSAPSNNLAETVERIQPGGCTNLYGGWLKGAKLLEPGGRVILLSDGLANAGRYTNARDLEAHASLSYTKFKVVTSTIGIGDDYDEGLMAGMARAGGGAHYFARTPEAIMDAFSRESFSLKEAVIHRTEVRIDGHVSHVGTLLSGETRTVVVPVAGRPRSIRVDFEPASGGEKQTLKIEVPADFGFSVEATSEHLAARAASLEERAVRVRNQATAQAILEENRRLQLEILAHPLADEPLLRSVLQRLRLSQERLAQLSVRYEEQVGAFHRKRSAQAAFSMVLRGRGFSCFEDEADVILQERCLVYGSRNGPIEADPMTFGLRPPEFWLSRMAVPVASGADGIVVAVVDHTDGFAIDDLSKQLATKVRPLPRACTPEEIIRAIREAAQP